MRLIVLILAGLTTFALLTSLSLAQSHPAHEHGAAKLSIALEGDDLELSLESPLINFLPFERAPNNPTEEKQVKDLGEALLDGQSLFAFSAAAGCKLLGARIASSPLDSFWIKSTVGQVEGSGDHGHAAHKDEADHKHEREKADHHDEDKDGDHKHEHEKGDHHDEHDEADHDHEHGDLDAQYFFECQKPGSIKEMEVKLFAKYPSLTRIDAQLINDSGQKAMTLDAKNTTIKW
ncbi:MAG: DUF2796 domain-containing protein [Deltaproteobacteria bacterium]|jgi:hypothetical protein|nr:DUF2796 domain-containing protein [Deltaproteobacteria bacterium]